MKPKTRMVLLGIYDLILALGATYIGVMMVNPGFGIYTDYPQEWLTKVPFTSWVTPGIIAITVFGLGNIVSAIFCCRNERSKAWMMSAIMGGIFLVSLIAQVILLGEWYLATQEFLILSIIQILLSGYALLGNKKLIF
jgi:hypothetical protein